MEANNSNVSQILTNWNNAHDAFFSCFLYFNSLIVQSAAAIRNMYMFVLTVCVPAAVEEAAESKREQGDMRN